MNRAKPGRLGLRSNSCEPLRLVSLFDISVVSATLPLVHTYVNLNSARINATYLGKTQPSAQGP